MICLTLFQAFANGKLAKEKKVIKALRQRPGVTIDLTAVDCLDEQKTKTLFSGLPNVAGVFYVAVRLNDALFLNLKSEEDWKKGRISTDVLDHHTDLDFLVHDVKVKGVRILLDAVDPKKLDFLVLTSSMATVSGSPGQVNYSAAQTEMEAMGANIPNCISVAVPPLVCFRLRFHMHESYHHTDRRRRFRAKYAHRELSFGRSGEVQGPWNDGYETCSALRRCYLDYWYRIIQPRLHSCNQLEASTGQCVYSLYRYDDASANLTLVAVPDYCRGVMRHLLVKEAATTVAAGGKNEQTILGACANVLSLDLERVEDNIPLSAYGLDSLTSVRLSGILKSQFGVDVTQLQLLSQTMTGTRTTKCIFIAGLIIPS